MKEIVFLSGKGGAGKTIVSSSIIAMLEDVVCVDCDVDAPNLHLIIPPRRQEESFVFEGPNVAVIDKSICSSCGRCIDVCRFSAISDEFIVDASRCEGCGFCGYVCPQDAVSFHREESGSWGVYEIDFGLMVYGGLGPTGENSGRLVSILKEKARDLAAGRKKDWIICDGPPGMGCPVISSLNNADGIVLVVESTMSGLEDAEKTARLCRKMNITPMVVINKWDLNPDVSGRIELWAKQNSFPLLGRISFDEKVIEAVIKGVPAIDVSPLFKREISEVFSRLFPDS